MDLLEVLYDLYIEAMLIDHKWRLFYLWIIVVAMLDIILLLLDLNDSLEIYNEKVVLFVISW